MGSRSIRAGIDWLGLEALMADGVDTVIDLLDRMGVERLMDGRLSSAGLMSGILAGGVDGGGCDVGRPQSRVQFQAAARRDKMNHEGIDCGSNLCDHNYVLRLMNFAC